MFLGAAVVYSLSHNWDFLHNDIGGSIVFTVDAGCPLFDSRSK